MDFAYPTSGLGRQWLPAPSRARRGRKSKTTLAYRKMGIQRSIAARVHSFKRVAEPLAIMQVGDASQRLKVVGNTGLLDTATVAFNATPDDFIANASQVGIAFKFNLQQVANSTEITNLFDHYRIKKVRLTFTYSSNSGVSPVGGPGAPAGAYYGGGQCLPIMHHAYDPDDSAAPTSREQVLENGYCQTKRLDRVFSVDIMPRAQSVINNGPGAGGVAGGLLDRKTWLDTDSPAVNHYGLKCWLETFPFLDHIDSQFSLLVTPTFYIEARNVI